MTHKRKVNVQAALVVDERCIADAVRLDPITNILAQLEVVGLCAIQLI